MAIDDSWENFLDWSDEHGLPFKGFADKLEEIGVPALPAFAVLVIFLILLGVVFLSPLLATTPAGDITVTVLSLDKGLPVPGVTVHLSSAQDPAAFGLQTATTDASGIAFFTGIPAGQVQVTASSEGYTTEDEFTEIISGVVQEVTLNPALATRDRVTLTLDIAGPTDGSTVTTILMDSLYNALETQQGVKPSFRVTPDESFKISIKAAGFVDKTVSDVATEKADVFRAIVLTPIQTAKQGTLHAIVVSMADGVEKPVANASVDVIDAVTKAVVAHGLASGADGSIDPQKLDEGTRVQLRATKLGFIAALSVVYTITEDTTARVEMRDAGPTLALTIRTESTEGSPLNAVSVRLYSKKNGEWTTVEEKKSVDGYAEFTVPKDEAYGVSAYLQGRIPVFYPSVKPPSLTIRLQKSTETSTATLKVHSTNYDGSDAAGARIALAAQDGTPLGLIEKVTGIDGIQEFTDVPLTALRVTASAAGRTGASEFIPAAGNGTVAVMLERGAGTITVRVTDHFSLKPVEGAAFTVSSANSSSCTTNAEGACSVTMPEQLGATASITAQGYETYYTTSFSIGAGAATEVEAELIPQSIASNAKPEFAGFYNVRGRKVSTLDPHSEYRARFIVRSPNIGYANASFFVFIGEANEALEGLDAAITGYSGEASQTYWSNSLDAVPAGTTADALGNNGDLEAAKWVDFEFDPFTGSKALDIILTTKEKTQGVVEVHYRTEYRGTETVRSPQDDAVNSTLASAKTYAERAVIDFEGTCTAGVCLKYYFEQDGIKYSPESFAAEVGKDFSLVVGVVPSKEPATATLESGSQEIGVLRAESGGETVQSTQQPPAITAASIKISEDSGEATFTLRGQRVSKDTQLRLAIARSGSAVADKAFSIRVNSKGSPSLKITYTPRSLTALEPTKLEFTVKDALGLAVNDARVTVGGTKNDALGRTIEAVGVSEGKYEAEGVVAGGVGNVGYSVEAEGFSKATGRIPVYSQKLVDLREASIELNVVGRDAVEAPFNVNNLLSNEITLSVTVVKSSIAKYTDIAATPSVARIGANSVFNGVLSAQVSQAILGIAESSRVLDETVSGTLRITAAVGTSRQTLELPFRVTTRLTQNDIASVWQADAGQVSIELSPPDVRDKTVRVRITNNAAQPLLFNQQLGMTSVQVSPASLSILPGDSDYFDVRAIASTKYTSTGCVFEEEKRVGTLRILASANGLKSSREIPVTITTHASGTCQPNDPRQITLPVDLAFEIPSNALARANNDGTTTVQLADGTRFTVTGETTNGIAFAPADTAFTLEQRFISGPGPGEFTVTLPVSARLSLPDEVPRISRDGKTILVFGTSLLTLPSTASLSNTDGVRLPAGSTIEIKPKPNPDLSAYARVKLPAGLKLNLPANTIRIANPDASVTASLPTGLYVGLPPQAVLGEAAGDASFEATLRQGDTILLPPAYYSRLSGTGFTLQLPFAYALELPSDAGTAVRDGLTVAFLHDYDVYLPQGASFTPSENGKSALLNAGNRIEFRDFSRNALSESNSFASLPAALTLTLPTGTRQETTTSGIVLALSNNDLVGLPPGATTTAALLDGSFTATIPAGAQSSLPPAWVTNSPNGEIRVSIPLIHYYSVPAGTQSLQSSSTTTILLPEYDFTLSTKTALSEDGEGLSTKPLAGGRETFVPVPDVSLDNEARVTLPFKLSLNLPIGSRVKTTLDATGIIFPTGEIAGAANAQLSEDGRQLTVPAGAALYLAPNRVTATESELRVALPLGGVVHFTSSQLFKEDGNLVIVGDNYKALLPPNTIAETMEGEEQSATIPISGTIAIQATEFNAIGRNQQLPVGISIAFGANAIVRQKSDGSIYAEAFNNKLLFGSGSTLEASTVYAPANTVITFPYNAVTSIPTPGYTAANRPSYRLQLPLAFGLHAPLYGEAGNTNIKNNADGTKTIVLQDTTIILPRNAQATTEADAITASVPANSPVAFYYTPVITPPASAGGDVIPTQNEPTGPNGEVLPPVVDEPAVEDNLAKEAAQATKDLASNVLVQLPVATQFIIPARYEIKQYDGLNGEVVWLSSHEGVVFPIGQSETAVDGSRSITVGEGNALSLPKGRVRALPGGGTAFTTPFNALLTLPEGVQVVTERGVKKAYAEQINTQIIAPSSATQQGYSFSIKAGSSIEFRPLGQASFAGNVPVTLPLDATITLPTETRVSTIGSTTTVWLQDGSVAQFNDAPLGAANGRTLKWQANTQALLPSRRVATNPYTGARIVTLPLTMILDIPFDAKVIQKQSGTTIISERTQVELQVAIPSGNQVLVPAGAPVSVSSFGLDVYGATVLPPFELELFLPPQTIIDERAPGGIAVEYPNGVRIKFGGSSAITDVLPAGAQYLPYDTTGLPGIASTPYSAYGSQYGATMQAMRRDAGSTLHAPKLAPLTLPPALLSQGTAPESYAITLPSSATLTFDSESPVYTNADGSYSLFAGDVEVMLPPSATRAADSSQSGVGRVSMTVPPGQRISINKIYSGRIPGDATSLPFDLVLRLPSGARVLPLAQDGSRTLDFGNGARAVFDRDLIVDERRANSPTSTFNELVVTAGTLVTWSAGIVKPLNLDSSPQRSPLNGLELTIPSITVVRIPDDSPVQRGNDGTTLAFFDDYYLRLPTQARQITEYGQSGYKSYEIPANAALRLVPRELSFGAQSKGFSLPFDAIIVLPANAATTEAKDGSRKVTFSQATNGISLAGEREIIVSTEATIEKNALTIPAGTIFFPSESLITAEDKQTTMQGATATTTVRRLRTPTQIIVKPAEKVTYSENKDGSITTYSGTQEVTFGPGTKAQVTPQSIQFLVPANTYIEVKPIDPMLSGNTATLTLPVDAEFSTSPDTRILPPGPSGERAIIYSPGRVLVVQQDSQLRGTPPTITITASTPFAASAPLVRTIETDRRDTRSVLPPGVRFATPTQTTLVVTRDAKITRDDRGAIVVSTGYDEVVVPASAQIVQGRGNTATRITLQANTLIEVRPIDYDYGQLIGVTMPYRAIYALPASARARQSPDSQTIIVSLQGGKRLAFENAKLVETQGRATRVDAPEKTLLYVDKDATRENPQGFEITLPIAWKLILPNEATVPTTMPNTVRLPDKTSITTSFTPQLLDGTGESGETGNRKRLEIPAGATVAFGPTSFTSDEEREKNAGGSTGTLAFNNRENSGIILPANAKVESTGGSVSVVLQQCVNLDVKATADAYKLYGLPASIGGKAQGTVVDAGNGQKQIVLAAGTKVTLATCNPDTDDSKVITYYPRTETTFFLPTDTEPADNPTPTAKFPDCRQLQSFGSNLPLESATQLDFPSNSKVYPDPNVESELFKDKKKQVTVAAKQPVGIHSCADPVDTGSATLSQSDLEKPALEIKPSPLIIEIKSPANQNTTQVCVQDLLEETLAVSANFQQGGVRGDLKEYVDPRGVVWIGGFQSGSQEIDISPGKPCESNPYDITARIPEYSDDLDINGCIKEEKEIKGEIVFNARSQKDGATKQPGVLPVTLKLVKGGECAPKQSIANVPQFNDVYGTQADSIQFAGSTSDTIKRQLVFKAPKHVRVFALVNNRKESVKLRETWQQARQIASCQVDVLASFGGETKTNANQPVDGLVLAPGDAALVKCVSNDVVEASNANYEVTAIGQTTGEEQKTTILFKMTVYQPLDAVKDLYPISPIGELTGAEETVFTPATAESVGATGAGETTTTETTTETSTTGTSPEANPATPPSTSTTTAKTAAIDRISFADVAVENMGGATTEGGPGGDSVLVDPGVWRLCEEKFCDSPQFKRAAASYANNIYNYLQGRMTPADEKEKVGEKIDAVYKTTNEGVIRKSFVLQKAGRDSITEAQLDDAVQQGKPSNWKANIPLGVNGPVEGCGIWFGELEVRLKPSPILGSAEYDGGVDFSRKYLDDADVKMTLTKVYTCADELNNLALLTGRPELQAIGQTGFLNPEVFVGQERVEGNSEEFGQILREIKEDGFKGAFGAITIGSYRDKRDAEDTETAQQLYEALYNQRLDENTEMSDSLYDGTDAAGWCVGKGAAITAKLGGVMLTESLTVAAISIALIATGAGSVPGILGAGAAVDAVPIGTRLAAFGKQLARSYTRALANCGAIGVGAGVGSIGGTGGNTVCQAVNACIYSEVFDAATFGIGSTLNLGVGPEGVKAAEAGLRNTATQPLLRGSVGSVRGYLGVAGATTVITGGIRGLEAVTALKPGHAVPVAVRAVRVTQEVARAGLRSQFVQRAVQQGASAGAANAWLEQFVNDYPRYTRLYASRAARNPGVTATQYALRSAGLEAGRIAGLPAGESAALTAAASDGAVLTQMEPVVAPFVREYGQAIALQVKAAFGDAKPPWSASTTYAQEFDSRIASGIAPQQAMEELADQYNTFRRGNELAGFEVTRDGYISGAATHDDILSRFADPATGLDDLTKLDDLLVQARAYTVPALPGGAPDTAAQDYLDDVVRQLVERRTAVTDAASPAFVQASEREFVQLMQPKYISSTGATAPITVAEAMTIMEGQVSKNGFFNRLKVKWGNLNKKAAGTTLASLAVSLLFHAEVRPVAAHTLPPLDSFIVATQSQPFRKGIGVMQTAPLPSITFGCEINSNVDPTAEAIYCGPKLIDLSKSCEYESGRGICLIYGKKPNGRYFLTTVLTKGATSSSAVTATTSSSVTPASRSTRAPTPEKPKEAVQDGQTTVLGPAAGELFRSMFRPDDRIVTPVLLGRAKVIPYNAGTPVPTEPLPPDAEAGTTG